MTGIIIRLMTEKRYGFIRSHAGDEYFFHAEDCIDNSFDDLAMKQEVQFNEANTSKGLRARNVKAG